MSSNPPAPDPLATATAIGQGIAPFAVLIPNPIAAALVTILARYGPAVYGAAVELIHNANPTKEQYLALLDFKIDATEQSYVDEARVAAGGTP